MANPAIALAMSFGLGLIPWAPGTFGAAGAFVIFAAIWHLPWLWQLALTLALLLLGCVASGRMAAHYDVEDHPAIVWDETTGMLTVLVLTPATPLSWVLGFLAFRTLDIRKPWPIHLVESRVRGGAGVMLDDAVAGLGAAGLVWIGHLLLAPLVTA